MTARRLAPRKTTQYSDDLPYRVWVYSPDYLQDPNPQKCAAAFRFLQECLDYIASLQDRGVCVVFQSPEQVKTILSTDRRVVYKADAA